MSARKTLVMIMSYIIMISIIGPSIADSEPKIEIDDDENKVKFQKFSDGDPWNIDLRDTSNVLRYHFDGTIGMDSTEQAGNNWMVWFQCKSTGAPGIERIIVPGTYNVYANGVTDGGSIEKSGEIIITEEDITSCGEPIPPIPELSTVALISAGMLGIVLVSRKYRR